MKPFTICAFAILVSINCYAFENQDSEPSPPPFWEILTINGVDSDNDGVRDDVEIWINHKCKDQNMRLALKKLATSYESLIKHVNDREGYIHESMKYDLRTYCWRFVTLNYKPYHAVLLHEFHAKVLNTPLRSYYFKKGFSNLPGGVVRVPDVMPHLFGVACEFDIINPRKIIAEYLAKTPGYEWGDRQKKEFKEIYESKSIVLDPFVLFHMERRRL